MRAAGSAAASCSFGGSFWTCRFQRELSAAHLPAFPSGHFRRGPVAKPGTKRKWPGWAVFFGKLSKFSGRPMNGPRGKSSKFGGREGPAARNPLCVFTVFSARRSYQIFSGRGHNPVSILLTACTSFFSGRGRNSVSVLRMWRSPRRHKSIPKHACQCNRCRARHIWAGGFRTKFVGPVVLFKKITQNMMKL